MKKSISAEGQILLKREKKSYDGGYGIVRADLTTLGSNIHFLHPAEKDYYYSLKYDRRKITYLLGRFAAKKAINSLGLTDDLQSIFIDFGIFHFPVVKSPVSNIQVSISHCQDIGIALAFSEEHPMGIDIEKIDDSKIHVIKSQLTNKELKLIADCNIPMEIGCTILWTIKEGLSKVFKTGFTIDIKLFEIQSLEDRGKYYMSSFVHCFQYKAISYHIGNYICSIILPGNTELISGSFLNALMKTITEDDN